MNTKLHPEVAAYLKERARIAGKAGTGKCKVRTREQCQKAARVRWERAATAQAKK